MRKVLCTAYREKHVTFIKGGKLLAGFAACGRTYSLFIYFRIEFIFKYIPPYAL